jgi:hypothetical protein
MAINITQEQLADPGFKITPEAVGYRDGTVHCNSCGYFNPATNECDLIEDEVAPLGSCELHQPVDGEAHEEFTEDFEGDDMPESEDAEEYESDEEYMENLKLGKYQSPAQLSRVRPETERERNEEAELEDEAVPV